MSGDTTMPGDGGSTMDAGSTTQLDGTVVKRQRVEVGYGSTDGRGRLADDVFPLPTTDERAVRALVQLAEDVHAIRLILEAATE